jgi:hypothetical protein
MANRDSSFLVRFAFVTFPLLAMLRSGDYTIFWMKYQQIWDFEGPVLGVLFRLFFFGSNADVVCEILWAILVALRFCFRVNFLTRLPLRGITQI